MSTLTINVIDFGAGSNPKKGYLYQLICKYFDAVGVKYSKGEPEEKKETDFNFYTSESGWWYGSDPQITFLDYPDHLAEEDFIMAPSTDLDQLVKQMSRTVCGKKSLRLLDSCIEVYEFPKS
jgi:hypothetical protein